MKHPGRLLRRSERLTGVRAGINGCSVQWLLLILCLGELSAEVGVLSCRCLCRMTQSSGIPSGECATLYAWVLQLRHSLIEYSAMAD